MRRRHGWRGKQKNYTFGMPPHDALIFDDPLAYFLAAKRKCKHSDLLKKHSCLEAYLADTTASKFNPHFYSNDTQAATGNPGIQGY